MMSPAQRAGSDRRIDQVDGLCVVGSGRVGPFRLRTPAVLDSRIQEGSLRVQLEQPPFLEEAAASEPGRRRLSLIGPEGRWSVEFPIPTPEVVQGAADAFESEDRVALLHGLPGPATRDRWRSEPPAAMVLMNARALWSDPEAFVATVSGLREAAGPGPLLWLPRVALPNRIAFLTYLGGDILDTTEALFRATEGEFLDPELGALDSSKARLELGCGCEGCVPPTSLALHARHTMLAELRRVRAAALEGRLRELVESRVVSEPRLGEILRYADQRLAARLDETAPVVHSGTVRYVLAEASRRPEVRRFRERFLRRYRPPRSKRVLLLVPCSETKPYRKSPSHRRFARALEGLPALERIHVVSVTSPLGLVPRELEDMFPARHYDIPVTGDWSEPERESIRESLRHLLEAGPYDRIIAHLAPEEYHFLRDQSFWPKPVEWTVTGERPGAGENLDRLREAASNALAEYSPVEGGPLTVVREELESLAAFQFGPDAAHRLFADPVRLAGRPWFQRITDGHHTDLATWREERGLFHLTVAGALRMLPEHVLEVAADPQIRLEGDLFCPGVLRAAAEIRPGDSVSVSVDGELVGVGEAHLPGPWMTSLSHGLAVRVRHRLHPPPPTTGVATGT